MPYGAHYGANYQKVVVAIRKSGGILRRRGRRVFPKQRAPIKAPEPVKTRYTIIHDVSSGVVTTWLTPLEGKVSGPFKVLHLEGKIISELITDLRGKLGRVYQSLAEAEVAISKEYAKDLLRRIYIMRQLKRQMGQRESLEKQVKQLKEELEEARGSRK